MSICRLLSTFKSIVWEFISIISILGIFYVRGLVSMFDNVMIMLLICMDFGFYMQVHRRTSMRLRRASCIKEGGGIWHWRLFFHVKKRSKLKFMWIRRLEIVQRISFWKSFIVVDRSNDCFCNQDLLIGPLIYIPTIS